MICQHDVEFAALGTHGKATHVIDVDLADGFNLDMEFLGLDGRDLAGDVSKGVEGDRLIFFLRGPDAFLRMGDVSFEGLY